MFYLVETNKSQIVFFYQYLADLSYEEHTHNTLPHTSSFKKKNQSENIIPFKEIVYVLCQDAGTELYIIIRSFSLKNEVFRFCIRKQNTILNSKIRMFLKGHDICKNEHLQINFSF